jgi:hypothetical protein
MHLNKIAQSIQTPPRVFVKQGGRRIVIDLPTEVFEPPRHYRARAVRVVNVAPVGFMMPDSYHDAIKSIAPGEVFSSAAEASRRLGFDHNSVAARLNEAKHRAAKNRNAAVRVTIRGITLEWVEAKSANSEA